MNSAPAAVPRLARRTEAIAPFQVMELVKQATLLAQQGHPIIHLSIGEPDFTAPPSVIEALERAARAGRAQYTPAVGTPELRAAIAEDTWRRHGVRIAPERVVITAGASAPSRWPAVPWSTRAMKSCSPIRPIPAIGILWRPSMGYRSACASDPRAGSR